MPEGQPDRVDLALKLDRANLRIAELEAENAGLETALAKESHLSKPVRAAAEWMRTLALTGPDLTVNAHKKAAHEALELAENPTLEEAADVIICLVGTALGQGWTADEIAAAISTKNAVNAERSWRQEPDGTWQHVAPLDEEAERSGRRADDA